jgi:ribose 5-phosphate isomerase A
MNVKESKSNVDRKKLVGAAGAQLVQDGMLAGIGTGSTMAFLIEELGRRVREDSLHVTTVPTSFQSRMLCMKLGIPVREMQDASYLDLAIDGADEVDPGLDLIKGGGASLTREKIVAAMAREFVVVVDESKLVARLGQSFAVPVEALPSALGYVEKRILALGGTSALRLGVAKDGPVVTDNGQFILDLRFPPAVDLRAVDHALHSTPGVVETGLFFSLAHKVLVAQGAPAGHLVLQTFTRANPRPGL